MKRLFALIGFSYLVALMAAIYFGARLSVVLFFVFLALFVVSLFFKKVRNNKVFPIALMVVSIAFGAFAAKYYMVAEPVKVLDDKDVIISGVICELPTSNYDRFYYTLQLDKVDFEGAPQNIKIRVSASKALEADVYDRVTGKVHMFSPEKTNDYYSSLSHYASKDIYMTSYLYEYEPVTIDKGTSKPIYYYALKSRESLICSIRSLLPQPQSAIAIGVLLGEKGDIPCDIVSDFNGSGLAHLMAVSGFHVAIMAQFFMLFATFVKLPKRFSALLAAIGVLCFVAITGFSPSSLRAGIMSAVYFIGISINRQSDSLNSLGLAVLLITILNPFSAGDVGLLLSIFATLGIILCSKHIESWIKDKFWNFGDIVNRIVKFVSPIIAVSLAATIFDFPILMLIFKRAILISPLSNLLVSTVTGFMMIFIAFAAILNLVSWLSFIVMPLALFSGVIINYVIWCVHWLARIPFSCVPTTQPFMPLWLAGSIIIFAAAYFFMKDLRLMRVAAILSVIFLITGIFSYQLSIKDKTFISILDVGDGCSILLSRNGHAAVISCGGDEIHSGAVSDCIYGRGINKIDYMLLSSYDERACGYADEILEDYGLDVMLSFDNRYEIEDTEKSYKVQKNINFNNNAKTELWENVYIDSLNIDNRSWTYLIVDEISFLICPSGGDAEKLPYCWLNPDVFIMGALPQNSDEINCIYSVMSMSLESAEELINSVAVVPNRNIIATAGDGNISFEISNGADITVRRFS